MRPSTECHRILLLVLLLLSLCTPHVRAQKNREDNLPKSDAHTETKMQGSVEDVELPPKGREEEVGHLLLKGNTETVVVYLCPEAFLDDMGGSFAKGDEIAVTGSRVKQGEAEVVLAHDVVRGADTLVLRDAKAILFGLGSVNGCLQPFVQVGTYLGNLCVPDIRS
jgi:hypothetical protein